VPRSWVGWLAALLATLITLTLVVVELSDSGQRRWWARHPLTTSTVAGLLVLLVTVLVVNQLLNLRQARQRGNAVAAQAAIVAAQAARCARAMSALADGSGERAAASDAFRSYMQMLLVGAPVLIDDPVARHFLEQAQYLGGVMAHTLAVKHSPAGGAAGPPDRMNEAIRQLKQAAAPLLQQLTPGMRELVQRIGQIAEE
jgi:hypothetical protein